MTLVDRDAQQAPQQPDAEDRGVVVVHPARRADADALQRLGVPEPLRVGAAVGRAERWGFAILVASFFAPVAYLIASNNVVSGDALSRTLSAAQAAVGRDPHLEAVGFVWPPFPALFQVPLIWLGEAFGLGNALVQQGLAGTLVSAALMTAMVCGVREWLAECGVGQSSRLLLALLLAIHPFVVLYAGNGMSEASMLCFLVIAANRLSRWWEQRSPVDLAVTGVGLAFAYLSRYEVGLAVIAVTAAVALEAWYRSDAERVGRLRAGAVAGAMVAFIPVSAMVAWAGWSWATIGEPFAQFTSAYGNSAIVDTDAVGSGVDRLLFFTQQVVVFGAATLLLVVAAAWFATRRLARVVAALLVMFSPVLFNLAVAVNGTTFDFARFSIATVPAGMLLIGPLLQAESTDTRSARRTRIVGLVAVAAFAVSGVVSLRVMWAGDLSTYEETGQLGALPWPYANPNGPAPVSNVEAMSVIARDIDALDLDDGSVISDVFSSFMIVLSSDNRDQFITTPDRDFEQVLASPRGSTARYLLVPSSENSNFDAVRNAWPGVFEGDNDVARLYLEWGSAEFPATHYRLYRLTLKDRNGS